jgi:hypothetical protein
MVKASGLTKHGEIREMLKEKLGLGHGDANALVHALLQSDGQRAAQGKSTDAVLDEIYSGPKAVMRPIHDALIKHIAKFGEFENVPKKGYISLRRKKQFAMIGPRPIHALRWASMTGTSRKTHGCWNSPREACAITSSI